MMAAFFRRVQDQSGRIIPIAVALLLGTLVMHGAGCSNKKPAPPPPKTFPVTGKVVTKAGTPVVGGMVEFQSKTNKLLSVTSEIQPDGTFSLTSRRDGQKFPGAEEGEYEVTLFPPMTASQTTVPQTLPKPVKVEPKENNLTLTAPEGKP
jgi:hypothetical protein